VVIAIQVVVEVACPARPYFMFSIK